MGNEGRSRGPASPATRTPRTAVAVALPPPHPAHPAPRLALTCPIPPVLCIGSALCWRFVLHFLHATRETCDPAAGAGESKSEEKCGASQVWSLDTNSSDGGTLVLRPRPLTQPVGIVVVVDTADLARSPTNDLRVMAGFSRNGPWQAAVGKAAVGKGWAQVHTPNSQTIGPVQVDALP